MSKHALLASKQATGEAQHFGQQLPTYLLCAQWQEGGEDERVGEGRRGDIQTKWGPGCRQLLPYLAERLHLIVQRGILGAGGLGLIPSKQSGDHIELFNITNSGETPDGRQTYLMTKPNS